MARKTRQPENTRLYDMLDRYGELCTQEAAAFILGVSSRTVRNMLKSGKLRQVGRRVDVRSICAYIDDPVSAGRQEGNLREMFFNASVGKFSAEA